MNKQIKLFNFHFWPKAGFLHFFYLQLFLLIIFGSYTACENEQDLIGQGIVEKPKIDKETLNVVATTMQGAAIISSNNYVSLLGTYNDPIFGKGKASFVTEVFPYNYFVTDNVTLIADAIVLHLKYQIDYQTIQETVKTSADIDSTFEKTIISEKHYYGDTMQVQRVFVYELTTPLTTADVYSNNKIDLDDSNLRGTKQYFPYNYDDDYLTINLDKSLAERILNEADTTHFESSENFYNFLSGFYITIDDNIEDGAIISFDLLNSKLTIDYHKYNEPDTTLLATFFIDQYCKHYNIYETESDKLVSNQEEGFVYTQAMGGVSTKITFPTFLEWRSDKPPSSISKAELIIPIDRSDTTYQLPEQLALYSFKDTTKIQLSELLLSEYFDYYNNVYIGESLNEDSITTALTYNFNITRYVQNLFNNRTEGEGLRLLPYNSKNQVRRAILNDKMKLVITYVELD